MRDFLQDLMDAIRAWVRGPQPARVPAPVTARDPRPRRFVSL
jgi:hypothetical protein